MHSRDRQPISKAISRLAFISIALSLLLLAGTEAFASLSYPLITGVVYNPEGADEGGEWVELYNPTNETIEKSCTLLFGNGANPDDWTIQWSGNLSMGPASYLLIGEDDITPEADIEVDLSLQNGPDAVKLVCEDYTDVVGWGELSYEEYFEGTPAASGPEGSVLSRKFESIGDKSYVVDTGNNSFDFTYIERSAHSSLQENEIMIHIGVADSTPDILAIENCTDDMTQDGYQLLPGKDENSTFSCDVAADDANGADDILMIRARVYYNGTEVSEYSQPFEDGFSITFPVTQQAGEYMLGIQVADNTTWSDEVFVSLQIISSIGITLFPTQLFWEDAMPGTVQSHKVVTINNTGNVPVRLTLTNELAESGIDFDTLWQGTSKLLQQLLQLQNVLPYKKAEELHIAPQVQSMTKAGDIQHQGLLSLALQIMRGCES
jgi:hypothetical protein